MQYTAFRMAELLARWAPVKVAYGISRRVSTMHYRGNHLSRRDVALNLMQIAEHAGAPITEAEAEERARETFINFGRHVVDFFRYHRMNQAQVDRLVDMENVDRFDEMLALGRGFIGITAHMGSWETAGSICVRLGLPVSAVALPQPNRKLNEFFQRHRTAHGLREIPFGTAARECLRRLKNNEMVGLLADRDFTPHQSTVKFFGRPARLSLGPARLALVSRAPIVPLFLLQLPGGRFRFTVRDPILPERGMTQHDIEKRIVRTLEDVISKYPTQWFLFHHFWDLEADVAVVNAMRAERMQVPAVQPAPPPRDGVHDVG